MTETSHAVLDERDYRALLAARDRIRMLPPEHGGRQLPVKTATQLAARIRWLRSDVIPRLDCELGVCLPFVAVYPSTWRRTHDDGSEGLSYGTCGPYRIDPWWVFAIRIPASTLMIFDNDLLEGVLAHEFLHYVFNTIELHRRAPTGGDDEVFLGATDIYADLEMYLKRDREERVSPNEWLSPRLQTLVARIETPTDPGWITAHDRLMSAAKAGIPLIDTAREWHASGAFAFDRGILDRVSGL